MRRRTTSFVSKTEDGGMVIVAKELPFGAGRPPDPAVMSASRARKLLALARKYADAGYAADAVLRLEAILSTHAETSSAPKARELLQSIREQLTGEEPYGYGKRSW